MNTPNVPTITNAVDVNVHLSRWPFRRLPLDENPAALVAKLRALGIRQAWAGSFDALLHRDAASVNARLHEACTAGDAKDFLLPFGVINPALPDWEDDLRRCRERFRMPGIRIYPNYHGYTLADPAFHRLLALAAAAGMVVQVAVSMEDERTQHPLVRVPPVDLAPLPDAVGKAPEARVVLLNALRAGRPGGALAQAGKLARVSFDIAALEGAGGVGAAIEHLSADRLLFGTHSPFFYPEAAALKMAESTLEPAVTRQVLAGNAEGLLRR